MSSTKSGSDRLGYRFLALPRELRDLIYPYIVTQDAPINLTNTDISSPVSHPLIAAEWLEAIYTYNTCSVTFSYEATLRYKKLRPSIWGAHAEYKSYIRRLIVNADEAPYEHLHNLEKLEEKYRSGGSMSRLEWTDLLELPRLESLTINLQKTHPKVFSWTNFSPILYEIREQIPRLCIIFKVSFDAILESIWNEMTFVDNVHDGNYEPMGFVDVSELIAAPTDEDRGYVDEHMRGSRDLGKRDIVRGLLDESAEDRRVLAQYYLVKESSLLRVLMAKQYEIYKRIREAGTILK